jgi:methylated-DNA-[protein]-cysteine S-methyltransferase
MSQISTASPVGALTIVVADDAVVMLRWGTGEPAGSSPLLGEALRQLDAYFAGQLRHFDLPLAPRGSEFETRVWRAMRAIPPGKTSSYGTLAREIGSAPRAVGRACGTNPIPIIIPCHRVVAQGGLGGYSGEGGLATKRALLALEGAVAGRGGPRSA